MSLSYSELVQPSPKSVIQDTLFTVLALVGFPVTAWPSGSAPRAVISSFASGLEEAWFTVAKVARSGIIRRGGYSMGPWLDLAAQSQFREDRKQPVSTVTSVRLTDHGGGPHMITVGTQIVGTASGLQYRCTAIPDGPTLALNDVLDIDVTAVQPGAKYNVPESTINTMVTTLPTVTVENIDAITTLGADVETDDLYTDRVPLKWATLSTGSPPAAYEFWALTQGVGVTRAHVDDMNPDGPNTIRVYVDIASTGLLQTYIQAADGSGKAPAGSKVRVVSASNTTIALPLTIQLSPGTTATASAAILANLAALSVAIKIGGIVRQADIVEAIMREIAAVDVTFSGAWTGTPNIQLAAGHIPVFDVSGLAFVEGT